MKRIVCSLLVALLVALSLSASAEDLALYFCDYDVLIYPKSFAPTYDKAQFVMDISPLPLCLDVSGYDVTIESINAYKAKQVETSDDVFLLVVKFDLESLPEDSFPSFFDALTTRGIITSDEDGNDYSIFYEVMAVAWVDSKTASLVFASANKVLTDKYWCLALEYESSTPSAYIASQDHGADAMFEKSLICAGCEASEVMDFEDMDAKLAEYLLNIAGYTERNSK